MSHMLARNVMASGGISKRLPLSSTCGNQMSGAPGGRAAVHLVRAEREPGYTQAMEMVRKNRIAHLEKKAKKKAEEEAAAKAALEESIRRRDSYEVGATTGLVAQKGDVVKVRWDVALASTGEVVDHGGRVNGLPVQFQIGTDAGFEPKQGLKLAFNYVTEGLRVGETAQVICRPSGTGWFKAFEVVDMNGQMLAQLTHDEKQKPWAQEKAIVTVEVLQIQPPPGRSRA